MSETVTFKASEWFVENSFPGVRRCKTDAFRIAKKIVSGKSKYQEYLIFESPGFGKMFALDRIIQLSQSDEFIYHEMIVHVPLLTHPNPKRFLVVGGGDGGVLREATKHPLKELCMVDIDEEVVGIARKHLGFISDGAFNDKRVNLLFADGKNFIKRHRDYFDVIVIDSTDPVGPGKALFEGSFYADVAKSLTKDGVAIFQIGPLLDFNLIVKGTAGKLKKLFAYVNLERLSMPSYSCGCEYCFIVASKTVDPAKLSLATIRERAKKRLGSKLNALKYYTPEVHQASLVMPKLWQIK